MHQAQPRPEPVGCGDQVRWHSRCANVRCRGLTEDEAPNLLRLSTPSIPHGPLFHVSLKQSVDRSDPNQLVPSPVSECCQWIREHGLKTEGVFRKPGSSRHVGQWIKRFNEDPFTALPPNEPPENAATLIVRFLKNIKCNNGQPGAKLWGATADEVTMFAKEARSVRKESGGFGSTHEDLVSNLRGLLQSLPVENQATFKAITGLLAEASRLENTTTNLMDPQNLALCVAPEIQWVLQNMIESYEEVFDGIPAATPPLDRNVARMWHGYQKMVRHLRNVFQNQTKERILMWHRHAFPLRYSSGTTTCSEQTNTPDYGIVI
eukprot:TRINITY_DN1831_c0_g1_i3.p1 TRINITY_DN1831_c0_g1~~TRINITY_DN1831_c0_g1_i3.p1  ORF type:complete len:320 (+),score=38.92 TRINITY_DN1831_c0_g1_i3:389-1348(+)